MLEVDCAEGARSITWSGLPIYNPDPGRITKMELWRTTGDQAITLYKVHTIDAVTVGGVSAARFTGGAGPLNYTDSLPDDVLSQNESLPILTEDGYPSADRFGVPPADMAVMTFYQDRAWYAVSSSRPNTICFSEVDEPESVPEEYELTLEAIGDGGDAISGLFSMEGVLYVAQGKSLRRLVVTGNPLDSASAVPAAQRGMLNHRCHDLYQGVAYIADGAGLYAFDGNSVESLSDPVGNYWSDDLIDFTESKWFSVRVDPKDRVVRFYHSLAGDSGTYPTRALCYSLVTKAWWTEQYAHSVASAANAVVRGRPRLVIGTGTTSGASLALSGGRQDAGQPIQYSLKTGNLPLVSQGRRSLRMTYTPTPGSETIGVACFYNGASAARPNAVATDIGNGVASTQGGTQAVVQLGSTRSALGTASGVVVIGLPGRLDDRSVGGDKDVAFGLSGTQGATEPTIIHRLEIEGAGA
jgi:hypothetical protein